LILFEGTYYKHVSVIESASFWHTN